jgi:uncharacterized protein (TIGR03435 family)
VKKHLLTALAVCSVGAAQETPSPSPPRPQFEVASIKDCSPGDPIPPSISSPGRLSLGCWPLSRLIGDAYETFANGNVDPGKPLVPFPIEGAPAWVNSARYTIDATTEGPQSGAMMRGPMMQALLEDRFQLKVHREAKEISGYIMTVDKGGLKLKPAPEGSCRSLDPTDLAQSPRSATEGKPLCLVPTTVRKGPLTIFEVHGVTLDIFAGYLHPNGKQVVNRTGLTGAFDIHLELETDGPGAAASDGRASDPSPHTSEMMATREQLGLRLEPGKGTREVLVIDRVEKPSKN